MSWPGKAGRGIVVTKLPRRRKKKVTDVKVKPDSEALYEMAVRGGSWAAYENQALDSANMGHVQFLKVGDGCTFKTPPKTYPSDNANGMGWRYVYVGMVDLKTGEIVR